MAVVNALTPHRSSHKSYEGRGNPVRSRYDARKSAARMINEIANPRPVLVGERYTGHVVKTTTFGAFVNLVPGRDGLVHISKLGKGRRLSNVEDAVREGDTLEVEVQEIDGQGKISLKPVGEEWDVPAGTEDESGGGERRPSRDRERSGDRGRPGGGGGDRGRGKRFRDREQPS